MNLVRILVVLVLTLSCTGCWNPFSNPLSMFGIGNDSPSATPDRVENPTDHFILALGGVTSGWDDLIIRDVMGNPVLFGQSVLNCWAESAIVEVTIRPGYFSQSDGSGVRLIPRDVGVTAVRCTVDGTDLGRVYEVTIPPQSLIQILVAEATEQLADEATLDEEIGAGVVTLGSESSTGNALGAVIRNRIQRILDDGDPSIFGATPAAFETDPFGSYYDAVITAPDQFSPVLTSDPTHDLYERASARSQLSAAEKIAYDQAVLTAGGIFNGDIEDPTQGAFAFRSPTVEEWELLQGALASGATSIPEDSGFTDASFPTYAPIQIEIIPEVWKYSEDKRPSFVFARELPEEATARVVELP